MASYSGAVLGMVACVVRNCWIGWIADQSVHRRRHCLVCLLQGRVVWYCTQILHTSFVCGRFPWPVPALISELHNFPGMFRARVDLIAHVRLLLRLFKHLMLSHCAISVAASSRRWGPPYLDKALQYCSSYFSTWTSITAYRAQLCARHSMVCGSGRANGQRNTMNKLLEAAAKRCPCLMKSAPCVLSLRTECGYMYSCSLRNIMSRSTRQRIKNRYSVLRCKCCRLVVHPCLFRVSSLPQLSAYKYISRLSPPSPELHLQICPPTGLPLLVASAKRTCSRSVLLVGPRCHVPRQGSLYSTLQTIPGLILDQSRSSRAPQAYHPNHDTTDQSTSQPVPPPHHLTSSPQFVPPSAQSPCCPMAGPSSG